MAIYLEINYNDDNIINYKLMLVDGINYQNTLKNQYFTFSHTFDIINDEVRSPSTWIQILSNIKIEDIKDNININSINDNYNINNNNNTLVKHRRMQSQKLLNLNNRINKRNNYRTLYQFDNEQSIVLLKDETLKSQKNNNKGYIYYNNQTNSICNDGTKDSIFSKYFLFEITIINFKQLKKIAISKHSSIKNILNVIKPIVIIKNIGNSCYLRCDNIVNLTKYKISDIGKISIVDHGSEFKLLCNDSEWKKKNNYYWKINKDYNGLYTLNMIKYKNIDKYDSYRVLNNQYLTFGKTVKIDHTQNTWTLPKKSTIKMFK